MPQAFVFNNTNSFLSVLVIGPQAQARFFLGPNSVAPVQLSFGLKGLLAFANGGLFAMRPIQATAENQVFAINPNNVNPGGGPVVFSAIEPDNFDISGVNQSQQVVEEPLIQELVPGQ